MDGEKKLSIIGEPDFSSESSKESMEEFVARYRKPGKREPNFWFHMIISAFIYPGVYWGTFYWFDFYLLAILIIIPFVGGFLSVFLYCIRKQANPFEVFFLSIVPGLISVFFLMLFGLNDALIITSILPAIFPVAYLGGIFGYLIGRAIGVVINN